MSQRKAPIREQLSGVWGDWQGQKLDAAIREFEESKALHDRTGQHAWVEITTTESRERIFFCPYCDEERREHECRVESACGRRNFRHRGRYRGFLAGLGMARQRGQ